MRGKFRLLLFLLLVLASCSKSNPWSRTRSDSRSRPGLLVINVDKVSLEKYLSENNKKGRVISESKMVYEVEDLDQEDLKKSFPQVQVLENTMIISDDPYAQMNVTISKEEALARSKEQLAWIGLEEAHKITRGKGVTVAVIDTGINVERWDLKDSLWTNPKEISDNGIDDDNNGFIDDVYGWNIAEDNSNLLDSGPHGTMSAGVIASSLTGVAPEAKIMTLKVMDRYQVTLLTDMIEAVVYAMDKKADIINLSMGIVGNLSEESLKVMNTLTESKIFLSIASGNYALDCSEYPFGQAVSKIPNAINVAALTLPPGEPQLASYSHYGDCVDIAAPSGAGAKEIGTYLRGLITSHPYSQEKYFLYNGTSAAAPVVAGVAALVKSIHPDWTPEQIKAHLLKTATPLESLKGKVSSSAMINAYEAVK